tara:strand:+ start:119076 stop:121583 length:2508 start_codon:yes stop_codon:yes gene_type:complete
MLLRLIILILLSYTPGLSFSQAILDREDPIKEIDSSSIAPKLEFRADSISYELTDSTITFLGDVVLNYGTLELKADQVKYDTKLQLLTAGFLPNPKDNKEVFSRGITQGAMLRNEGGTLVGERMQYNLKTGEGLIWEGRTKYEEGFFNGNLIQLNSDSSLKIEGGTYTTCNNPTHQHYFLKVDQVKIIPGDKAIVKHAKGYVFGVPVFYLPAYAFSVRQGRQSGLTIPNYGTGKNEGHYLRNIGYYWAPNEYFDLKVTGDIETKTGFIVKNRLQYRRANQLRGTVSGSWRSEFGRKTTGWDFFARHWQEILPGLTLRSQVAYAKSLKYLNSTTRGTDAGRLIPMIRSSFSLNRRWGQNNLNFNIASTSSDGKPRRPNTTLSFRFATRPIFKNDNNKKSRRDSMPSFNEKPTSNNTRWYHSILFGFNNTLRDRRDTFRRDIDTIPSIQEDEFTPLSSFEWYSATNRTLSNVFNLSAPQTLLGWLKIRPQTNYTQTWTKTSGQPIKWGNRHSLGIAANTTVYGLFQTQIGRLSALRHVVTPLVSFTHVGSPNTMKTIRLSVDNIFQAKIRQQDGEKKYNLFYIHSSLNYNLHANIKRWSDLTTSIRIPSRRFNVNINLNHDFYNPKTDKYQRPWLESFVINTSLNLLGSSRSRLSNRGRGNRTETSWGSSYGNESGPTGNDQIIRSSSELFGSQEFSSDIGLYDAYNRFNQGFDQVKKPWMIRLTHRYLAKRMGPDNNFSTSSHEIRAVNRFQLNDIFYPFKLSNLLTNNWRVQHAINFDYRRRKVVTHSLDLYRQLHCWEITLRWVPTGINKGIYFRLNIMAHPDVKLEQERRFGF